MTLSEFAIWSSDFGIPLGLIAFLVVGAILAAGLFQGVREVVLDGINRRSVLKSAVAIMLFFGFALLFWISAGGLERTVSSVPALDASIDEKWGGGLSSEQRTKDSSYIARTVYISTGQIRNYIDKNGVLTPYGPTSSDEAQRRHQIEVQQTLLRYSRTSYYAAWLCGLVPVVVIVVSLLWSTRNKKDKSGQR